MSIILPKDLSDIHLALIQEKHFDPAKIYAEEAALVETSAQVRKTEFFFGRLAARAALSRAGCQDQTPILRGSSGQPIWPDGYCGSISHCRCYNDSGERQSPLGLSAVSSLSTYRSLGVDIEHSGRPVNEEVSRKIGLPAEQEWMDEAGQSRVKRLLMLLTAKEALYKALYPLTSQYFGFGDASFTWQENHDRFQARLLRELAPDIGPAQSYSVYTWEHEDYIVSLVPVDTSPGKKENI